jgi:hypothetical protein
MYLVNIFGKRKWCTIWNKGNLFYAVYKRSAPEREICHTNKQTNKLSTWSSPVSKTNTASASQGIPQIGWNPKFHYRTTTANRLSLFWVTSILPTDSFKVLSNTILPPQPRSSKCSVSLRFPHQSPLCTPALPRTCHMLRPSHPSWFDHPENIWWCVRIISLVIVLRSVTTQLSYSVKWEQEFDVFHGRALYYTKH